MNSRSGGGAGISLLRDTVVVCMILMLVGGCGDPPVATPPPQTGSVHIVAMDTAVIDSIDVGLDDMPMGRWKNPATLHEIIAGTHFLSVRDRLGFGQDTMVRVADAEQSSVLIRIQTEGPYVGSFAPAFRVPSVTGDTIDLVKLRGKVVLLAFFEHT